MPGVVCRHCGHSRHVTVQICPHCAIGVPYPNVLRASQTDEREALAARYDAARSDAGADAEQHLDALERALRASAAVRAVPDWEVFRLGASESNVAVSYYAQVDAGMRQPEDSAWDSDRRVTDATLFPAHRGHIQYAALTIDQNWPRNWGDGALTFRSEMIAHRTTVYEENSVIRMRRGSPELDAPGHRATWDERAVLGIAKLGRAAADGADPGTLVFRAGGSRGDDDFIEVHVYGPYTLRSITRLTMRRGVLTETKTQELRRRAEELGFSFEVDDEP